jgi:hypothetical protein
MSRPPRVAAARPDRVAVAPLAAAGRLASAAVAVAAEAQLAVAAPVVAALALVPAPASAAPFGELPFAPVRGAAVCLSPTGTPGELVRWVSGGAELLDATPAGLVPRGTIELGAVRSCPVAATDAGGAGVAAGTGSRGIELSVRDPGQPWGAPLTIPAKRVAEVSVAVSARGDAVVAWAQYEPVSQTAHVLVARRVPGGAFGAPQRFDAPVQAPGLQVAVTADGAALLVISDRRAVQLASAAPGGPFAAPRRLARVGGDGFGSSSALAVTPDGRALLAADVGNGLSLFDREPGADFVQRPSLPSGGGNLAVALAPDGTAVVASESGDTVYAVMRDGLGSFTAPARIVAPPRSTSFSTGALLIGVSGDGPPLETSTPLRVALSTDRRALVTWTVESGALRAATLTTAGAAELATLGSPLRGALGATPLVLPDGRREVTWTDGNDSFSAPPYAGRLHLAVEGAVDTPAGPTPRLTVGAPADRTLRPAQPLVLPVRCSAACDLRVAVTGQDQDRTASLNAAGTIRLRFEPRSRAIAPAHGPLKVGIRFSAPGARTDEARAVSLRMRRLSAPPFPRISNVSATRGSRGTIDVRWSTDVPVRDAIFVVYGTRTRRLEGLRAPNVGVAKGAGRRSFHVRIHDATRVRYVRVRSEQRVGRRTQTRIVSVRSRA